MAMNMTVFPCSAEGINVPAALFKRCMWWLWWSTRTQTAACFWREILELKCSFSISSSLSNSDIKTVKNMHTDVLTVRASSTWQQAASWSAGLHQCNFHVRWARRKPKRQNRSHQKRFLERDLTSSPSQNPAFKRLTAGIPPWWGVRLNVPPTDSKEASHWSYFSHRG